MNRTAFRLPAARPSARGRVAPLRAVSRRTTTRRAVRSLAALAIGASLALSGCAAGGAPGAGSAAAASAGTITWGWALPSTWDPVTSAIGNDLHALALVYEPITQQTADGDVAPGLAESWEYNEAGDEVTFHLRPGLTFSDGTRLDAEAVRQSLLRGRDGADSTVAAQLAVVRDVVVDSPTDVRLVLDQPDFQIPLLLSGKTGQIVSPAAIAEDTGALATRPVGAGPFILEEYVPDSHATLRKNPDYWNAEHIRVDEFVLKPTPDPSVIVAGLQSGQYNVVSIPASQVDSVEAAGFEVLKQEVLPVRVLDVNNTVEPFDDPRVTQAISHAIDRQELIDVANFGYGEPLWQPFPDGYVAHSDALDDLYPHDPDRARELLTEAGYPDGVDIELAISAESDPLAELIQQQLTSAGIRTSLVVQTPGEVNYITRKYPFVVDQFNARQSPVQALEVLFGEEGLMNLGRNTPADLPAAVDAARALPLDHPDYPAAIQNATETAVTQMPNVFLFSVTRFFAYTDEVKGLRGYVDTWRFEDVTVGQ
ncbi:ABC transporter substrate-binding protein [Microbacterium album]|uniref:Peptide ABC transporter substrate-binding protein n=1 Tax=Microbacterium album TaxID=2053191 RepID=A0A917MLD2_9MICO|nr:ABC transporter substrate-binding protein [Microbacterium album]GGH41749.1 peptide ABC transporter substrate-binding protein [Microbacterium album]